MGEPEVDADGPRGFSAWWRATGESELRQILYWVWDPIGISAEFPDGADEYDGYALEIATAVMSDMPVSALAALLGSIEENRMGITGGSPQVVAERLRGWLERSRRRYAAGLDGDIGG